MITDRIGLQSVLLPLLIVEGEEDNHTNNNTNNIENENGNGNGNGNVNDDDDNDDDNDNDNKLVCFQIPIKLWCGTLPRLKILPTPLKLL